MHTLFCYYCLFCPSSIQLCALYYSDLKMTEELSKHISKKCRYTSASILLQVLCFGSLYVPKQEII